MESVAIRANRARWEWRLEDAHLKDAHSRDTQVSTFEQATENKELNYKDAHPRHAQVSTFEQVVENTGFNGESAPKALTPTEVSTFDAFEDVPFPPIREPSPHLLPDLVY